MISLLVFLSSSYICKQTSIEAQCKYMQVVGSYQPRNKKSAVSQLRVAVTVQILFFRNYEPILLLVHYLSKMVQHVILLCYLILWFITINSRHYSLESIKYLGKYKQLKGRQFTAVQKKRQPSAMMAITDKMNDFGSSGVICRISLKIMFYVMNLVSNDRKFNSVYDHIAKINFLYKFCLLFRILKQALN